MKNCDTNYSTKKLKGFRAGDSTQIIKYYLDNKINTFGKTNRQELMSDIVSSKKGIFILKEKYIRDVIQIHQNLGLLNLYVPHTEEYTLPKEDFLSIAKIEIPDIYATIGDPASIPDIVILLREPTSKELSSLSLLHFRRYYWSLIFHGEIHKLHLLWEKENKFSDSSLNAFIENIDRNIFEEIRYVLTKENLLFDPKNDREVVYEFMSYFLQFYNFAPQSLNKIFPRIKDPQSIYRKIETLGLDIEKLLHESRPNNAITVEELIINREYRLKDPQPDLPLFETRYHLDKIYDSPQFKNFFGPDKIKFRKEHQNLIEEAVDNVIGFNGVIGTLNFKKLFALAFQRNIVVSTYAFLQLNLILKKYLKSLYKPCTLQEKIVLKCTQQNFLVKEKFRINTEKNHQLFLDKTQIDYDKIVQKNNVFLTALMFPLILLWNILFFIPSRLLFLIAKPFYFVSPKAQKVVNNHSRKRFCRHLKRAHRSETKGNMAIAVISYKKCLQILQGSIDLAGVTGNTKVYEALKEKAKTCSDHIREEFSKEYKYNEQEQQNFTKIFDYLLKLSSLKNLHRRLLQDIQKSYVDARKKYIHFGFTKWVFSFGKTPLRTDIPSIPLVKKIRALRSIEKRIYKLQVRQYELNILKNLITKAFANEENSIRDYYRPLLKKAFEQASFIPTKMQYNNQEVASQRESIALYKMQEEVLDLFINKGYVHMMDLRDIISRNQLKMNDLKNPLEFILGDQLLRLDKNIHHIMRGVHRRGEIYMRLIHRFSSFLFGFGLGRLFSKYILLPFGGAYVLFVLLTYVGEKVVKTPEEKQQIKAIATAQEILEDQIEEIEKETSALEKQDFPDIVQIQHLMAAKTAFEQERKDLNNQKHEITEYITQKAEDFVLYPHKVVLSYTGREYDFRTIKISWLVLAGLEILFFFYTAIGWFIFKGFWVNLFRLLKILFIKIPRGIWLLPPIQILYKLKLWRFVNIFIFRPALYSLPITIPVIYFTSVEIFVHPAMVILFGIALANAVINTSLGRNIFDYIEERVIHFLYEFNQTVFVGLFDLTIEVFKKSVQVVERLLYAVDDFFRFRQGENIFSQILKVIFGRIWQAVNYIFRFTIILVAEPQLNPIKHFPIVTISHKIILGFSIPITKSMDVYIEYFSGGSSLLYVLGTSLVFFFIQFGLPGICGFMAWELRENRKLYKLSAAKEVKPSIVGSHGETITGFLREGFHSGTIPKLYQRMRNDKYGTAKISSVGKIEYEHHHICSDIEKFLERSFCQQFRENPRIQEEGITISLGHASIHNESIEIPVIITVEEEETIFLICYTWRHNILSAYIQGDISALGEDLQEYLQVTLMVLWKKSGVDMIPEQMSHYIEKHLKLDHEWRVTHRLEEDYLILQIYADNSLIPVGELSYNLDYEDVKPRLIKAFSSQYRSLSMIGREKLMIRYQNVIWQDYDSFVAEYTTKQKTEHSKKILPEFLQVPTSLKS